MENSKLREAVDLAQQALVPLKKENERVVGENNTLHREIIDVKEELEATTLKWRAIDQQSKSEIEDSQFVIKQKEFKLKELEDEILSLKEALNNPGMEFKNGMSAAGPLQPGALSQEGGASGEGKWKEELKKADERATELSRIIKDLENERNTSDNTI